MVGSWGRDGGSCAVVCVSGLNVWSDCVGMGIKVRVVIELGIVCTCVGEVSWVCTRETLGFVRHGRGRCGHVVDGARGKCCDCGLGGVSAYLLVGGCVG